jgi:hypothetical protein
MDSIDHCSFWSEGKARAAKETIGEHRRGVLDR